MVAQGWKVAEHRSSCNGMRRPCPSLFKSGSFFSNTLPRRSHVPGLCVRLTDAKAKSELSVQFRVGQVKIAAAVQPVHDRLINRISSLVAEAHQVQGHRRSQFEVLIFADPLRELLRQLHVAAN